MKSLFTLITALFSLPCLGMMNPGQSFKAPGEIVAEINEFKKSLSNDPYIERIDNPQKYAQDAHKAEQLVHEALFANYICDIYKSNDRQEFEAFINSYQAWTRDPQRSWNFCGNDKSETCRQRYADHLEEEREKILTDCQKCIYYKKQLGQDIEKLQQLVLYRKPRIKADETL